MRLVLEELRVGLDDHLVAFGHVVLVQARALVVDGLEAVAVDRVHAPAVRGLPRLGGLDPAARVVGGDLEVQQHVGLGQRRDRSREPDRPARAGRHQRDGGRRGDGGHARDGERLRVAPASRRARRRAVGEQDPLQRRLGLGRLLERGTQLAQQFGGVHAAVLSRAGWGAGSPAASSSARNARSRRRRARERRARVATGLTPRATAISPACSPSQIDEEHQLAIALAQPRERVQHGEVLQPALGGRGCIERVEPARRARAARPAPARGRSCVAGWPAPCSRRSAATATAAAGCRRTGATRRGTSRPRDHRPGSPAPVLRSSAGSSDGAHERGPGTPRARWSSSPGEMFGSAQA